MASVNRVILVGRTGKEVELRHTTTGTAVASFSLATTEKMKNKSGEWEEKTEWHNVVFWAKQAEIAAQYLQKGHMVYIEGRLQTRKWQDKDGNDHYTTEIVGERLQLLTPKSGNSGNRQSGGSGSRNDRSHNDANSSYEPGMEDDEIPF